jgi:hypothetical protein
MSCNPFLAISSVDHRHFGYITKLTPPKKKKKKTNKLCLHHKGGGARKTQYRLVLATSLYCWGVSSNPTSCKLINHQNNVIK